MFARYRVVTLTPSYPYGSGSAQKRARSAQFPALYACNLDATLLAMALETLLVWLIIGLIAGWLAAAVVGGGYGLVGDMIVGVVGAFIGGWLFRSAHVTLPFAGLPATIFVAFVGAVILLVLLRLINRARAT